MSFSTAFICNDAIVTSVIISPFRRIITNSQIDAQEKKTDMELREHAEPNSKLHTAVSYSESTTRYKLYTMLFD